MNIWKIDENELFYLAHTIQNNDFFCSLTLTNEKILAGSRDGFIKVYDSTDFSLQK